MPLVVLICSTAGGGDTGVYTATLDNKEGRLTSLTSTSLESPTFIAAQSNDKTVYTTNRTASGEGIVSAYDIDEDGTLVRMNYRSSHGAGPCYVSVDGAGRYVFVANYDDGSVAVFPTESDGRLGKASDVVVHEGSSIVSDRQTSPHPHAVVPGPEGRFVYVPDLGTDRVVVYQVDDGSLQPADRLAAALPPGSGPRHIVIGPSGESAFLVNELNSTLTWLVRDPDSGGLSILDTKSALPGEADPKASKGADVHIHPSGQWVYVSNRGHDSVTIFEPHQDALHWVGHISTGGRTPRDFVLDPTGRWLFAENRDSDQVTTFSIDSRTGKLEPTGSVLAVPHPTAAVFIEL